MSRSGNVSLISGLLLLIPAAVGLLASGIPRLGAPLPLLTVVPAFFLASRHWQNAAIAIPSLLFFAWNPGLFHGAGKVPLRSYILLAVLVVLSVCWFVAGWKLGLEYQGSVYVQVAFFINLIWVLVLIQGFARAWRRASSFWLNLILHWSLFAWLAWYAFPYLGELP